METKISKVRLSQINMPRIDHSWKTAAYTGNAVEGFILEIESNGIIGIGGTAAHPKVISSDDLETQLNGPVRHALQGADALGGNKVRRALQDAHVHPRASLAADLALHDLAGKLSNFPCYALWGGASCLEVTVVRMVGIKPPDELVGAVRNIVEQGFMHLKVKIGTGIAEDVERIQTLRKAFGHEIWIGVDGNGAYTKDQAIELSQNLEPYGVSLIEQPIDERDLEGLAKVTAASTIPIMADQNVIDVKSALTICQSSAAHLVSIKATKMGSLDECRRVFEVCQAFGIRVHIGGSAGPAVIDVAQAQLAASMPGIDMECEIGESLALKDDPISGVKFRNGRMELGTSPGWGIRYDRLTSE